MLKLLVNFEICAVMRSFRKYSTLLLPVFLILLLPSCEQKEGAIHIRIINRLGNNAEILVKDREKEIPADGKYHLCTGYIETQYTLTDVVWDSVLNWKPTCPVEQLWRTEKSLDRYFGEFEKLPWESWYTLTLDYNVEYSEPIVYSWLKDIYDKTYTYYNIEYTYIDNSKLEYSPKE
jgi:hypothetical protein